MKVSTQPPDTEWIEVGKAAGTGLGGVLVGFVANLIRSRKNANRRIKNIEHQVEEIQSDRAAKYMEFQSHRADMVDAVAGLRDSVERVDAKVDAATHKQSEIAENVAYIRGLIERNGKSHG